MAWLTMATGGPPLSVNAKSRPASSGVPNVSKYRGPDPVERDVAARLGGLFEALHFDEARRARTGDRRHPAERDRAHARNLLPAGPAGPGTARTAVRADTRSSPGPVSPAARTRAGSRSPGSGGSRGDARTDRRRSAARPTRRLAPRRGSCRTGVAIASLRPHRVRAARMPARRSGRARPEPRRTAAAVNTATVAVNTSTCRSGCV